MVPMFPLADWQSFQNLAPIQTLLGVANDLRSIEEWPLPSTWQKSADDLDLWKVLGVELQFTLEEKLGQRAKRKVPKQSIRSYEASILERNEIPTRANNLHDFFNALIWLNFPRAKFTLHNKAYQVQREWSERHALQQRCPLAAIVCAERDSGRAGPGRLRSSDDHHP